MKRFIKTIYVVLILPLIMFSCSKKGNTPLSNLSGLSIVNASPSFEKLDVYVDNTKVTGDIDFTFGSKIDYLSVYSGTRQMTLTKKGQTSPLKQESFILEPQFGYTLFVVDQLASVKFLLLPDNLTKPAKGMASIRFANLSPDSEPLTLSIEGAPSYLITNISFKEHSNPMEIETVDKVSFHIREHRTGQLVAVLPDVKVEEGKIYTIYVKGLKGAVDETRLSVAMYTHK